MSITKFNMDGLMHQSKDRLTGVCVCHVSGTEAARRLKREDHEFEATWGYRKKKTNKEAVRINYKRRLNYVLSI